MLKKYLQFINESRKPLLRYMAFDWDDNILFMPTKIYMQEKVGDEWIEREVGTEQFAKIRGDKENWRYSEETWPFSNFRDFNPNVFYSDALKAIREKKFGPSWETFINCLVNGTVFAIITARGHEPKTIKRVVKHIIRYVLTEEQKNEMAANLMGYSSLFDDEDIFIQRTFEDLVDNYLKFCDFIGVSSQSFMKKHPQHYDEYGPQNPEEAKKTALDDFLKKLQKWAKQVGGDARLGFSDDDVRTVDNIEQHFNEINDLYDVDLFVFDTSNPENIVKKEI